MAASGIAYKEWIVSGTSPSDRNWFRKSSRPVRRALPRHDGRGPRSLVDMAASVLARNMNAIPAEHVEFVPERILWQLWKGSGRSYGSLHAWKIFSKHLSGGPGDKPFGLFLFSQNLDTPTSDLSVYLQPLRSHSVDFVTFLSLVGTLPFEDIELLPLARLENLAILEVVEPSDPGDRSPRLNDRTLRTWSEQENPFPMLRVLRIWGRSVTEQSLRYMARFPSLVLLDVVGGDRDWGNVDNCASEHGWTIDEVALGAVNDILAISRAVLCDKRTPLPSYSEESITMTYLGHVCADRKRLVHCVQGLETLETRSCHVEDYWPWDRWREGLGSLLVPTKPPWETQLYWLYTLICRLHPEDGRPDVEYKPKACVVTEDIVLPPKPMACLRLGSCWGSPRRQFTQHSGSIPMSRFVFVRAGRQDVRHQERKAKSAARETRKTIHSHKRQKVRDVFSAFT